MSETANLKLPLIRREATIEAVEGEENTFRAVYSTGAAVRRWDWEDGLYSEELSLAKGHIRADRLDAGIVPILKDHRQSVDSQFGVVVKHWIEGGKAYAEFRMESGTPEADALLNKLRQGILRTVSVGYRVHKFVETRSGTDKIPVRKAVDWEPMEISLVAIPADAGAVIRSEGAVHPCEVEVAGEHPAETPATMERAIDMPNTVTDPAPAVETRSVDVEAIRKAAADEARAAERARVAGITEAVRSVGLDTAFADTLINEGRSLEEANAAIVKKLAKSDADTDTRSTITVGHSYDAPEVIRAAAVDVIASKVNPSLKLEGKANEYRGHSMMEVYAELLEARGERVSRNRVKLAERALQGVSDFPEILRDSLHRVILDDYEAAKPSYKEIARQVNLMDFREHEFMRSGEFPSLKPVSEHGEVKSAALGDATTESMKLGTEGIILGITRQTLIDDHLGQVAHIASKYGRRVAASENQKAYAVLKANAKLKDGVALFHSSRKNLHSSAVATPDLATLSKMRAVLKQHRSDGIPLNFSLKYILSPTELETEFEKLQSAILATASGDVNVFSGKFKIITDAELDDHDAWYGATSPDQAEVLAYGYLNGASGPDVKTREGWSTLGAEIRLIHDFAVTAIGEKGIYKVPTK